MSDTKKGIAVFLGTLAVLSLCTIGSEITKIDVRFALMVQDMAKHGITVFPTVNGVEYGDYFSTWTILSYLTSAFGRFVNLFTLTLPTMICGAYIVAMTYLTGEKIGKNVGLYAAALSLVTFEYMASFVTFGLDVFVAAASITMLYCFLSNVERKWNLLIFALLAIAVFFVRGPLGLVVYGAACGGWLLASRKWKHVLLYGIAGVIVVVICAAGTYFIVQKVGGEELYQVLLDWQIRSKVSKGNYSCLYYFTNAMGSFAPLTLFGIATLVMNFKRLLKTPYGGLAGYILLPLIILSIPGAKHLRYITLSMPAFALLGGMFVCSMISKMPIGEKFSGIMRIVRPALPVLLILAVAGVTAGSFFALTFPMIPVFHYILCALLIGIVAFAPRIFADALARGAAMIFIFLMLCIVPLSFSLDNTSEFVRKSEGIRNEDAKVYIYNMGPDHDDLKYILHMAIPDRESVRYVYTKLPGSSKHLAKMYPFTAFEDELANITPDDIIIVHEKGWKLFNKAISGKNLMIKTVLSGRYGRRSARAVQIAPDDTMNLN